MSSSKRQTLIFFYIREIILYKEEVKGLIENLKKLVIGFGGEINLIVLREYANLNSESKNPNSDNKFSFAVLLEKLVQLSVQLPGEAPQSDFEVIKKEEGREFYLSNDELKEYFKIAFKDSAKMRKVFITFSHSSGFAINTNEDPNKESGIRINDVTIVNEEGFASFLENRNYRVIANAADINRNVNSKLWIYDLVKILEDVLEGPDNYIDLMLMVNCNMQILDTLFQLKRKVKVLVASQTQFSYYGFHYVALISTLMKYTQISPEVLSQEVVKQFVEKYVYELSDGINKLSCNTLFAHDLTHVHQLMELVNNVSDYLFKIIDDPIVKARIHELRNSQIADVTNYPGHILNCEFIDFGGFIKVLSNSLSNKRNRKFHVYHQMYRAIMKSMNQASFTGDDYTLRDKYEEKKFNISGVSVYFPTLESVNRSEKKLFGYLNFVMKSGYSIASKWDDFLKKLYDTSN